jgi:predicted N-acetyltransferase YhbS
MSESTVLVISPLAESELETAGQVVREAFAAFMGAPEPGEFWNDRDYVRSRWQARHTAWFKATDQQRLVGVVCVTRWGTQAVLGPLAVLPQWWDCDVAKQLLDTAVAQLDAWQVRHTGLFTFADSPRHLALYQRFGFWPQTLNAVMVKPVTPALHQVQASSPGRIVRYGAAPAEQAGQKTACAQLTGCIEPGLDLGDELDAVLDGGLGTSLLLFDPARTLQAFAICHFGPNSEAGAEVCYVKFAAVQPGPDAVQHLAELMAGAEHLAAAEQLPRLMAGVNTARRQAYRWMTDAGFRTEILGITMHRGTQGYDREEVLLIDDWR